MQKTLLIPSGKAVSLNVAGVSVPVVDLSQFPGATRRRGMDLDNAPVNSCYSEHNVALKRLPEQVVGSLSVARDTRNEIPAQHKDVKKPVLTREGSYV